MHEVASNTCSQIYTNAILCGGTRHNHITAHNRGYNSDSPFVTETFDCECCYLQRRTQLQFLHEITFKCTSISLYICSQIQVRNRHLHACRDNVFHYCIDISIKCICICTSHVLISYSWGTHNYHKSSVCRRHFLNNFMNKQKYWNSLRQLYIYVCMCITDQYIIITKYIILFLHAWLRNNITTMLCIIPHRISQIQILKPKKISIYWIFDIVVVTYLNILLRVDVLENCTKHIFSWHLIYALHFSPRMSVRVVLEGDKISWKMSVSSRVCLRDALL